VIQLKFNHESTKERKHETGQVVNFRADAVYILRGRDA
jgi:hypothetical protein